MSKYPYLGYGLGLRSEHYEDVLAKKSRVDWFEALAENYMGIPQSGHGPMLETLLEVRAFKPIVLHCVSSNIGGVDSLDLEFLKNLKNLINIIQPEWISDHLCWTGVNAHNTHGLLPMPYTKEAVEHVSCNINRIQDFLGQRFMIENTSSYMSFNHSEMQEWEFITEIIKKTDCGLLLDVNNVYVSSQNHDFNPEHFIKGIPLDNVGQIHLAGHQVKDSGLIIDTHDAPVKDEVFDLLAFTMKLLDKTSIMVEWDSDIPTLSKYEAELFKAKDIVERIQSDKLKGLPTATL